MSDGTCHCDVCDSLPLIYSHDESCCCDECHEAYHEIEVDWISICDRCTSIIDEETKEASDGSDQ